MTSKKPQNKLQVESKDDKPVKSDRSKQLRDSKSSNVQKGYKLALKSCEENLRCSIENSPLGIRITGEDGKTVFANTTLLNMWGCNNLEELNATPIAKRYTPESYTELQVRREKSLKGEAISDEQELNIVRKDGSVRCALVSYGKLFWEGNTLWETFYRDITDRKNAEKELKKTEKNLLNSMDTYPLGIRITDGHSHILYVNQSFLNIFGYKDIDEANASPPQEHYTAKSYAAWVERHQKILHGEPISEKVEAEVVRKDGSTRYVQIFRKEIFWAGKLQYQTLYDDVTESKRAENALKLSEENFRVSLDNSPVGIRVADQEWGTLYVNKVFLDIFGYANINEVTRTPLEDHYTPEERERSQKRKEKLLHGEPMQTEIEVEIVGKEGAVHHLQVLRRNTIWDGQPQRMVIYNDITKRKQTEEDLQSSERNFRNSLDSSPMGIRIINAEGNILYWNQAFLDIFGYENIREMRKIPLEARLTPEGFASYQSQKERSQRGEPIPDKVEIDIVRKDGNIRHLEVYRKEVLWHGKTQYETLYSDITERKKAEQALHTSETRYRRLFETAKDGILIQDAITGVVTDVNPFLTEMLGFPKDEFLGKFIWELKCVKDGAIVKRIFKELKNNGYVQYEDLLLETASGHIVDVEFIANIYDVDDRRVIQSNIRNVTEHKKAERALEASEKNLRNSLNGSPLGIYIIDSELNTLYANQALLDIFGYKDFDELRATRLDEHYTPESRVGLAQRRDRYLRGEPNPSTFELDIMRDDGTIRHLQAYRKEILWDGKNERQIIYADITERKQA